MILTFHPVVPLHIVPLRHLTILLDIRFRPNFGDMSAHIHVEPQAQITKTGLERIPNPEQEDKSPARPSMEATVSELGLEPDFRARYKCIL
jgi:hypothetical protein